MSRADTSPTPGSERAAPLFAALGDATRLRLLSELGTQGPRSITQLSGGSAVSRQAITKHLKVLSDAGYVAGTRCGREHIWQLRRERLGQARDYLERISREWDETLGRLKRFVED